MGQHFEVLHDEHQTFPVLKSREVDALQAKLFAEALATLRGERAEPRSPNDTPPVGNSNNEEGEL